MLTFIFRKNSGISKEASKASAIRPVLPYRFDPRYFRNFELLLFITKSYHTATLRFYSESGGTKNFKKLKSFLLWFGPCNQVRSQFFITDTDVSTKCVRTSYVTSNEQAEAVDAASIHTLKSKTLHKTICC